MEDLYYSVDWEKHTALKCQHTPRGSDARPGPSALFHVPEVSFGLSVGSRHYGVNFHGLIAILVPSANELGTVCWGTVREQHAALWSAPLGTYSHELHLRCDFCSCDSDVILGLFCVGSTAHLGCLSAGCDPLCNVQEAIMF